MNAVTENQNTENAVILKRVFNAPRQLVWDTWTEPELIAQWWAPNGMHAPLESITCDLREGGVFALNMAMDDGSAELPFSAVFETVDAPSRLVYVNADPESDSKFSATFDEVEGDKTEVTLVMTSTTSDAERRAAAEGGWKEMYDKLAKHLEK
jgi:uncharacterized protein YndB with AHSA1/START domain